MTPRYQFQLLLQIIQALEKFKDHPDSHFNFSRLCKGLRLLPKEGEELLNMVFHFQKLFKSNLEGYSLYKKHRNGNLYLVLQQHPKGTMINTESNEIIITKEHIKILSDLIYYFRRINIGKGFDLNYNGSELIHKIKDIQNIHPYFFEHRGNGLIYPTKLAVDLGVQILAYNRGNKPIKKIKLPNYSIFIK